MKQKPLLSKVMYLSWEGLKRKPFTLKQKQQRAKHKRSIRSLAVEAAWVILKTEDITVYRLVMLHSLSKQQIGSNTLSLTLFQKHDNLFFTFKINRYDYYWKTNNEGNNHYSKR